MTRGMMRNNLGCIRKGKKKEWKEGKERRGGKERSECREGNEQGKLSRRDEGGECIGR